MSDISEIITELNAHGFEDTDEIQKLSVLNDTLWDIESREIWPFLEKTVALNFDGISPAPSNLPSDFRAVLWLVDTSDGRTIWPEKLQTVRDRYGSQLGLVADPFIYYFLGSSLRLYPTPGASTGRFQLDYIATQPKVNAATLEAAIYLPKRHHRVITVGALWRLYKQEDDPENAIQHQTDYENRILRMREDLFRRQYQRADQIFVIDEYDDYPEVY